MPEIPESWQLDSGLRDSADFTIASAYFGTTANYQDGKVTLLVLVGLDETTNEMTEKLSVGADWVSSDGGATVVHPTKTRINKNSIYGHWMMACQEIPELMDYFIKMGEPTNDPRRAAMWNDLVLHVDRTEIKFGGKVNSVTRLLPTGYLGTKTVQQAIPNAPPLVPVQTPQGPQLQPSPASATVDTTAAIAAARARAAAAASQSPTPAVSPKVQSLIDMAKSHATHDEFMAIAFQTDEVLADDDLANQVADPSMIFAWAKA